MTTICTTCNKEFEWNNEPVTCPHCKQQYTVEYEESYDGEEETLYKYLQPITTDRRQT